ncbi:MAG: ABC transporter substrate-binding protein, partial [Alphaproteobacteria bacterium]
KKVVIGTEGAYPPFNNLTSDGKLVGFDVDIAKALCAQAKFDCTFVTQDWDGMIPALLANKFDAIIASMSITDERMEKIDFTDKYYNTPPAIAVPKNSSIKGTSNADLTGKNLGAQSATTHSNYAEEKLSGATLKLYGTPDEYKADIAAGRIDAVIDDVVVLSDWIKTDAGACCKILGTLVPDLKINGIGAGIGLRKGQDELKTKFNAAITAIRANGTYKAINDKYFAFDVYGG